MSTARRITAARRRIALNLGRLLVLGSTVSVLALVSGTAPAHAAFAGENGKIAFTSNRDGNDEIYVMNADGTDQTRLTDNAGEDDSPTFSPDGTKIAFTSFRGNNYDIYVMNSDGSGQTRVTTSGGPDSEPTFSPDGSKIAFVSVRDGNLEIYVMNADGTDQTRLTNDLAQEIEPAFSPDGTKIAFYRAEGHSQEIFIMNSDGTGQTNLTNSIPTDTGPSFSPDGSEIAFGSNRGTAGDFEVVAMDPDGSNQTNLTSTTADELEPAYSPDGAKIAYTHVQAGNSEIYAMNSDGRGQANLTDNAASDTAADWGPAVADVPPGAVDDVTTVGEDSDPDAIDVLANDTDSDGGPKVIVSVTDPDHGTVGLSGPVGARTGLTYEPDAGYCNDPDPAPADIFSYTLNGGSSATVSVTVTCADHAAPETTITAGPSGLINQATPTFTFTSSEAGSTFECRRDVDEPFEACTSPWQFPARVADGPHTFEVRATDAAGNVDPTPASRDYDVDTTPSQAYFTDGPSGLTKDATPTFEFQSIQPGATFECQVDDAAYAACDSPFTTAQLADGEHTVSVRAIDSVGNVQPIPDNRTFTVDTVAPDTTIDSGPSGLINDNTPVFDWETPAPKYECRMDDAPFVECEAPFTTATLSDGEHTFELRALDSVGNADPTPAKRTFTVDTAARVTSITGGPSGLTNDSTPTFTFATSDPDSTFECRVLPQTFDPCTSPYTSLAWPDGEHTFQVRSIDPAGNVESPAVGRTYTVDTVAPDATITSGPTGTIHEGTPTFGFSSSDSGATLECRVDGAAFGPCASPYTTALLANGSHTFQARAIDAAGNTDATPDSRMFTVSLDTTAPKTRIGSGPADFTNQTNATFTFSADEPATFECKLDTGSFAPCDSGVSFGPLHEGSHTFAVRATDEAGNVDPVPAAKSWIVDTTPPQTTLISGPSWLSLSSKATFVFASSEGSSLFECRLDGSAWEVCTNPRIYTAVHLGKHGFTVRAIDPAGNTDPTPAEASWFTLGLLPF